MTQWISVPQVLHKSKMIAVSLVRTVNLFIKTKIGGAHPASDDDNRGDSLRPTFSQEV